MRKAARLVALLGVPLVGWLLLAARPRDVVLVYDLGAVPGASALGVQLRRDGALVRDATFPRPGAQIRHPVRLPDGDYELRWTVDAPGGAVRGGRPLTVAGDETIVLPLAP